MEEIIFSEEIHYYKKKTKFGLKKMLQIAIVLFFGLK